MDSRAHIKSRISWEQAEFYRGLNDRNMAPLWEVLSKIVPANPAPSCVPVLWHYDEIRPLLMEAGNVITAKEAERRVLILENPGLKGRSQITQSLYAGLQLILPGETAPTHRHVPNALRFVIEGSGAYTALEGERTIMHAGDFILTPSWTYHDHGNPSEVPCIWMDGLDLPIVNLFNSCFFEKYPHGETQPVTRQEGDALVRYGTNVLPVEYKSSTPWTPIFNYPYSRSRETLEQLYRNGPLDTVHGVKVQYANPATGGYPTLTIAAFLQFLPKGFRGSTYRATDAAVYCVTEGHGRTRVGEATLEWGPRDIFVVPSWYPVFHEADQDAVLFSFSDRPAQKALGLWREEILGN